MKKICCLFLFCISLNITFGQLLSDTLDVYPQIKSYLIKRWKFTELPVVVHRSLLDTTNNEYGVFAFQPMTSENKPQIYVRDYKSKTIEIIDDYDIENVFKILFRYFEKNKKVITYKKKVDCIQNVVEVLQLRIKYIDNRYE